MRLIGGRSGAEFTIEGERVWKTQFGDTADRLQIQCLRQQRARDPLPFRLLKAPVLSVRDERPASFSFAMPFYRGLHHPTAFVLRAPLATVRHAGTALTEYLREQLRAATYAPQPGFRDAVLRRTHRIPGIDPAMRARVLAWTEAQHLPESVNLPLSTSYHGDLTWSNVLWSTDHQPHRLIDYTDSDYQTPLVDVAKLLMDCQLSWSARVTLADTDRVLYDWLMRKQMDEVWPLVVPWVPWVRILVVHYTLRLVPYNDVHTTFLYSSLETMLT